MRPHTLTTPKPLLPIAGKPIVQRLVEDISKISAEEITTVGFVISRAFGAAVEDQLKSIAKKIGAAAEIYYQDEALGTAHAIQCAEPLLEGPSVIAFADTLFRADFSMDVESDGVIWVKKVKDPSAFGVVKYNDSGIITDFVEKPENFISDLAIIGIYYIKDGAVLRDEINYVIKNDIKDKGEYQLTSALENMRSKGFKFVPGKVDEWLDCGNKDVTVETNQRYLEFIKDQDLVAKSASIVNSTIIPPVYVGENAIIRDSVVGPYVSIGDSSKVSDSRISHSIIQTHTLITGVYLKNSMLGNFVNFEGSPVDLSLGDYSIIKE